MNEACDREGCVEVVLARGLCQVHYYRVRRTGDVGPVDRLRAHRRAQCKTVGCVNTSSAKGYCPKCYQRWKTTGDPLLRTRKLPEEAIGTGWTRAEKNRFYTYSITPTQFAAMLDDQNGRCFGCLTNKPGPKGWQVDHDHDCCSGPKSCGQCVRGLACNNCNRGGGLLGDDPETLERYAAHIRAHRQARVQISGS